MHLEKLTDAARSGLENAFRLAAELRHPAVEPEHLLLALASEADGPAAQLLQSVDVDLLRLQERLRARLEARPTADHVAPSDQYLSRDLS
ncbi:MAG TPA: Clp protease N-terminal domain-containing protein, partial [Thermoplasmata archaeon]|nr:Clp protease N-terminal domain-containing protein [Thermoplasmata archaeon]